MFPLLEAAGAARGELTLAWDFTTRSEDDARGDLLAIRSDVMDRSASAPPAVAVVSSSEDVDAHIARRVELTVDVPLYLSQAEPGGTLNGSPPVASETIAVPVTVWIPRSVADRAPGDPPARLLQYGHGFFGGRVEADGFPAELADEYGFVIVAADWWGLSNEDQSFVAGLVVSDPANVMLFTDRLHQAFANFLTLSEAAVGPIAALPELEVNGAPAYDPGQLYFYGISMGHILGSTFVALSPRVERAVVSVGGANFSMMLFRARPFLPLLALLQTQLDDPLDQQKFAALAQSAFDRIDPLSYAPSTLRDTLPGSPASRQLLMHTGVADSEVPNVTSYFHARILGLPTLVPASPLVPSGLGEVSAPTGGSALTVFDFGIAPETLAQPASEPTPVHEGVRRLEASRLQVSTFLSPNGEIIDPCSGPCDPE